MPTKSILQPWWWPSSHHHDRRDCLVMYLHVFTNPPVKFDYPSLAICINHYIWYLKELHGYVLVISMISRRKRFLSVIDETFPELCACFVTDSQGKAVPSRCIGARCLDYATTSAAEHLPAITYSTEVIADHTIFHCNVKLPDHRQNAWPYRLPQVDQTFQFM